jgi:transcriptional regulator with XRE-family HTH domain
LNIHAFAERIKLLRSEKGFSQKRLGDLVGVSKVSIFNYENGLQLPSVEMLVKLAEVLCCSVDYLVGNDYDNEEENIHKFIIKSLKRNETVYNYLLKDTRKSIKEIENMIKGKK